MHPDDTLPEGAVRIPLRKRDGTIHAFTLVDATDAAWVNQWRWSLVVGGRYAGRWMYDKVTKRPKVIYLHRDLLGLLPGNRLVGDHINRDRLDNRRRNLRAIPPAGNARNRSKSPGTTSVYRGVTRTPYPRKRWHASVVVDGRTFRLGYFEDEHEAGAAAKAARLRLMPYAVD